MGFYGLYELHVKAKARELTNNFFNTLKLYYIPLKKLDSTTNVSKKHHYSATAR